MNIKQSYIGLFIICFFAQYQSCVADSFDDLFSPEINSLIDNNCFDIMRSGDNTAQIVDLLIDLDAISILQQNLYCHTNPLNKRNLVDSPLFLAQRDFYTNKWLLGTYLFWNFTDRGYFTCNSSSICSYLAVQNQDLIDIIDNNEEAQKLFNGFDINPTSILPLFANMTIQERRFGLMFEAQRFTDRCWIRLYTPLYYLERNFFLTEKEQDALERALGQASNDDKELFAKKHLISDKLGLGDTRFNIDTQAVRRKTFNMRAGFQATIPTAFVVAEGLLGSTFCPLKKRPVLDLNELFNLATGTTQQVDEALALTEKIMLQTLDTLSAMLLETGLGYDRHLGLGAYVQMRTELRDFLSIPWACAFFLKSRISAEYYLPACETRFYIENADSEQFEALGLLRPKQVIKDQVNSDPAYATTVLHFLEQQAVNRLIPFNYKTKVYPGFLIRLTNKFNYENDQWGFWIGTDWWIKTTEKLRNIKFKPVDGNPSNIAVKKAIRPFAYQNKLIGSLFYKVVRPTHTWTLGIDGDTTILNSGIGSDFTIALNIEVNF